MTPRQATSILMVMHEASHDARQKEALSIAVSNLRDRLEMMDRQYMRGWRDAKQKGEAYEA